MRQRAGFALLARAAAAAAAAAARGPASAPLEGSVASLLAAASLRSEFRKTWQAPISAAFSSFADAAVSADDETPTPQPPPPPRPIPRPRHSSSSSIPPPAKANRRAGGAGTDAASLASWKRGGGALPALAKGRKGGGSCGGGASGFGAAGAGGAGGTGTAGAKAAAAAENDAALLAWQQLQKLQQLQQQLQQQQQKQKRKLQRMQEQQRRMRNAAAAEDDDVESGGYLDDDDDDDDDDGRSDDERRSEEDEDERSDSDDSDAHGDNVGPAHPFTARAFYVGTPEAEAGLRKLRSAAAAASLPCVWDEAGNVAFCLTPGAIPTTAATTTSSSTKNAAAAKEAPPPPASPPPPPPPLSRDTPLPHAARYVAVFGSMGAVVFFNGAGYERALWRALAGGDLIGGGKGSGLLGGGGGGAAAAAEKKAGRAGKGSSSSSIVAAASISSALSAAAASSSSSNPPHDQPTDDVRLFVCPELRSPLRLNARLPASAIEGTIGNSGSGRPGGGAIDALLLRSARPAVIQTVACVAAQSVALHHYESRVDAELASFRSACAGMAATGSFRQGTPKEDLLRAVAANNVMLAAIMGGGSGTGGAAAVGGGNSSLDGDDASSSSSSSSSFNSTGGAIGVMSRLDVAWEDGEAAAVYEHLREDHEFALRLQNLELKLGFVQENLKYFLELMQARKSDTLEWTIIVLIAAEIGVSLFDMWSKAEGAAAAVVGSGGGGIV